MRFRRILQLGAANYVTILRFLLIPPVVILLVDGRFYAALAVYIVLAGSDVADGVVARRLHQVTELGVILDPAADIASNFAMYVTFFAMGLVPAWVLGVLTARYASLFLGAFAIFMWLGPIRFKATTTGKIVGVLQALVAILIIVLTARGVAWTETVGPVLYPFLGMIFGSVIISQLVIAIRHIRNATSHARSRG